MKRVMWVAVCMAFVLAVGGFAFAVEAATGHAGVDVSTAPVLIEPQPCDIKLPAETTATVVATQASPKRTTVIAKASSSSSSGSSSTYYPNFGSGTCIVARAASGVGGVATFTILDKSGRPMSGVRFFVRVEFSSPPSLNPIPEDMLPPDFSLTVTTNGSGVAVVNIPPAVGGAIASAVGFIPIDAHSNMRISGRMSF